MYDVLLKMADKLLSELISGRNSSQTIYEWNTKVHGFEILEHMNEFNRMFAGNDTRDAEHIPQATRHARGWLLDDTQRFIKLFIYV